MSSESQSIEEAALAIMAMGHSLEYCFPNFETTMALKSTDPEEEGMYVGYHFTTEHVLRIASRLEGREITDEAQAHTIVQSAIEPLGFKIPPAYAILPPEPTTPVVPEPTTSVALESTTPVTDNPHKRGDKIWLFWIPSPENADGTVCREKCDVVKMIAIKWLELNGLPEIGQMKEDYNFAECKMVYFRPPPGVDFAKAVCS